MPSGTGSTIRSKIFEEIFMYERIEKLSAFLLLAAFTTPFFLKSYQRISWSFHYPVFVLGFAYGIFCSMSCPTFYSMNSTGPARVVSIVYYGFVLTTFFCFYYLLGYLYRKISLLKSRTVYRNITVITSVIALLLLLYQCQSGKVLNCTTVKAVRGLVSGEAMTYGQEYQERLVLLRDDTVTEVILPPFEHTPDMLYVGDLPDDPEAAENRKMAQFYGKKSIIVDWSAKAEQRENRK